MSSPPTDPVAPTTDTAPSHGGSQARAFAGDLLACIYNAWVGKIPSRHLRRLYLRAYLGRFGTGTGVQLGVRFLNGRKVSLGARNVINFGTLFDGRRYPIEMGDDVSIGPEATVLTLGHDPQSPAFADRGGPVTIGDHVWIGYRAIILPGLTIGRGAVVAAGAIVSRDVGPFTIVAGCPARPVGKRNENLNYTLGYDPRFV